MRYLLPVPGETKHSEPAVGSPAIVGSSRWRAAWLSLGLLALALAGVAALILDHVGSGGQLLLSPADRRLYALHGTWNQMFDWGLADRAPVLVWVAALLVFGLVAVPYVWLAASSLPDRGFALARPVGLLLVGWLVWLLASVGLADFSRLTITLALLIVSAGAAAIALTNGQELLDWVKTHRRLLLIEEALFWVLFAAMVLIRFANPDLWHPVRGGEKPMDFAFLNSVTKSTHFPPYDPWFAGGQLNYYYFGFVLVAVLVKLTSVAPVVAYNLAIPTLFAFLGIAAFGTTLGLVDAPGGHPRHRRRPVAAALLGTLFVSIVGNLGEIRVLADRVSGAVPNDWWFWNATRVVHHPPTESGIITEFPWFTYLFADLHAHAMALPFTVVLLGLAVALLRPAPDARLLARCLHFLLFALALGALWPMNTWDVPTYALLAVLALFGAWWAGPRRGPLSGLAAFGLRSALLLALAYLLFLPFHRHYAGVFSGIERWHGSRTRMNDYLTIHGFFLFVIVTAVVIDLATSKDLGGVARAYRAGLRSWDNFGRFRQLHRALVTGSIVYRAGLYSPPAAVLLVAVLAGFHLGVEALVAALLVLTGLAIFRRRRRSVDATSQLLWRAVLSCFAVGLLITFAVEFVVAKKIDVGRTNTVFKFYVQVWVLWGIAAAVSVHGVHERLPLLRPFWRRTWRLAFVVLLAIACLYPALATPARIKDRFNTSVGPTLNGLAFANKAVLQDHDSRIPLSYDAAAIRWMLKTVPGSPVVAEVNTYPTLYGWGDRFAMFTGNPTIVGWDYHERQQRSTQSLQIMSRIADVQQAYSTISVDVAHQIFRRYGVSYFVVGQLERAYYPGGQSKWPAGDGRYWHRVYHNPGVDIYKLD